MKNAKTNRRALALVRGLPPTADPAMTRARRAAATIQHQWGPA